MVFTRLEAPFDVNFGPDEVVDVLSVRGVLLDHQIEWHIFFNKVFFLHASVYVSQITEAFHRFLATTTTTFLQVQSEQEAQR